MGIDYSPAGGWALHVRALAIIESNEDVGQLGDGGQAFCLLQQHPAFFVQWYSPFADVADTIWAAQIKAAAAFLAHYVPTIGIDLTIQAYNLGVAAVMERGKRNQDYLDRWTAARNKLLGGR